LLSRRYTLKNHAYGSGHDDVYTIKIYFALEAYVLKTDPSQISAIEQKRKAALNAKNTLITGLESNRQHNLHPGYPIPPNDIWHIIFTYLDLKSSAAVAQSCKALNTLFNERSSNHWQFFFARSKFANLQPSKQPSPNECKQHLKNCTLMEKKKHTLTEAIHACQEMIDNVQSQYISLTTASPQIPEYERTLIDKYQSDMKNYQSELEMLERNYPTPTMAR